MTTIAVEGVCVAVEACILAAVESIVTEAVTAALAAVVVQLVVSSTPPDLIASEIEKQLDNTDFGKRVGPAITKDIGSAATRFGAAAQTAIEIELSKDLSKFKVDGIEKLARMLKALSATSVVTQTEEELCEFRKSFEENADNDLIFLGVLQSGTEEGLSTFSDFISSNVLTDLATDPILGPLVQSFLSVLSKDPRSSLYAEHATTTAMVSPDGTALTFHNTMRIVPFGSQVVNNVDDTTRDRRQSNWIRYWEKVLDMNCDCIARACHIATPARHSGSMVGGHMQKNPDDGFWYILPICHGHNMKCYDFGGENMMTIPVCKAVRIVPLAVPISVMQIQIPSDLDFPDIWKNYHSCVDTYMTTAVKNVVDDFMKHIDSAVNAAGAAAKSYCHTQGSKITKISLIPFYGQVKAGIMLAHLKRDSLNIFDTHLRSNILDTIKHYSEQNWTHIAQSTVSDIKKSAAWRAFIHNPLHP